MSRLRHEHRSSVRLRLPSSYRDFPGGGSSRGSVASTLRLVLCEPTGVSHSRWHADPALDFRVGQPPPRRLLESLRPCVAGSALEGIRQRPDPRPHCTRPREPPALFVLRIRRWRTTPKEHPNPARLMFRKPSTQESTTGALALLLHG